MPQSLLTMAYKGFKRPRTEYFTACTQCSHTYVGLQEVLPNSTVHVYYTRKGLKEYYHCSKRIVYATLWLVSVWPVEPPLDPKKQETEVLHSCMSEKAQQVHRRVEVQRKVPKTSYLVLQPLHLRISGGPVVPKSLELRHYLPAWELPIVRSKFLDKYTDDCVNKMMRFMWLCISHTGQIRATHSSLYKALQYGV